MAPLVSRWLSSLIIAAIFSCTTSFLGHVPSAGKRHFLLQPLAAAQENKIPEDNDSNNTANGLKNTLRRLAQLSLEDYEWRSSVFKATQADRMVEESIARMRGEDPNYVRPMDATLPGPLGRLEKAAVEWLSSVIDEEAGRARKIVSGDGRMVRPLDGSTEFEQLGPLGRIEKAVVDFIQRIRNSEKERVRAGLWRPKDVDVATRGPLGEMEDEAYRIITEIQQAERLRALQSRMRGGEIVRPIDVPGPLGELELKVSEIFQAEKMRSQEKDWAQGKLVRPMDAKVRGPLGEVELQAYKAIKELNAEEMLRLKSIQKVLQENRPMESNRNSLLGIIETFIVGLLHGPKLLMSVIERVQELLQSEPLELPETLKSPEDTKKGT